jgi:hypothetical protein
VRVPQAIGQGKVHITLSFPDWKEGNVAPATFEQAIPAPPRAGTP